MRERVKEKYGEIKAKIHERLVPKPIFWENEVRANKMLAWIMVQSACMMILTKILNTVGVFNVPNELLDQVVVPCLIEFLVPACMCLYFKGEKWWLKYVMLTTNMIAYSQLDSLLSFNVVILIVIPVILSCSYFSRRLTAMIAFLTTIAFTWSSVATVYNNVIDLNMVIVPEGTDMHIVGDLYDTIAAMKLPYNTSQQLYAVMTKSFLPRYLFFLLVAFVAVNITERGRRMIMEQSIITNERSRIDTELNVAKDIQEKALPTAPDPMRHKEFDLAVYMEPAKEVGGDFYDFFFVDDTHLALVIADVSGKGVPAALFMMVSKMSVNNRVMQGGTPSEILADVNNRLCAKNLGDFFVSVWLGILDLTNGKLVAASAGHEYPVFRKGSGDFELVKDKHGLVLSCCEDMEYPETEYQLEPGDTVFVYTDGVAEANNAKGEQFTMQRMVDCLNHNKDASMQVLIDNLKTEIDVFAGEADQFDDITMLGFKLKAYMERKEEEA